MTHPTRRAAVWAAAALAYAALVCLLTWPLPLHLGTRLLGDPSGDTGVYVWNLWIFRHEILQHGRLPFSTDHVFAFTGGADFSLHNYAPIASLLGMPLIGLIGVVGTYNLLLIGLVAVAGLSVFLLARYVGLGPLAAWSAGALFVASPVISARETAHFSLIITAPLPLFLWALLRTLDTGRARDAALVGALVAVATYSDAYYGIYCALMGAFFLAWRFTRLEFTATSRPSGAGIRTIDILILAVGILMFWRSVSGVSSVTIGPIAIGLRTLYTPMLAFVALAGLRAWLTWRPRLRLHDPDRHLPRLVRLGALSVGVCLVLLLPLLAGIAQRFLAGRLPGTEIFWRSSPGGVDLLAYLVPNPTHAWFGDTTRAWFMPPRSDAFPEFVGAFSIVALAVIAMAAWRRVLPGVWLAFTGAFVALSLGPFIHVAGVNTTVIGPWAILRYVPVIGMARSPSRFAVIAVLGMSLLFAFAVDVWARRSTAPRLVMGVLGLALAFEMVPAPRQLYSAAIPRIYEQIVAGGDESGRLLDLPSGIRDGTSSLGDFNARSEYFQTLHHRPLIGGYLSRVSPWLRASAEESPVLRAIYALSERRPLPEGWAEKAHDTSRRFLERSCVRYVVVDKRRASQELRAFATEVLELKSIYQDDQYELLTPTDPPRCNVSSAVSGS